MVPVEQLLLLDELAARPGGKLAPESLTLEEAQEVQTLGVPGGVAKREGGMVKKSGIRIDKRGSQLSLICGRGRERQGVQSVMKD